MKNKSIEAVILQGEGSLFYFDPMPFCEYLASSLKHLEPKILEAVEKPGYHTNPKKVRDIIMWHNHIPHLLQGGVEEWFYESVLSMYPWRNLNRRYIKFDEFMHYWNKCVIIKPEKAEIILSKIKMPVAITANICYSHWKRVELLLEGFTFKSVLSYETKELDVYKTLWLAAEKLGKKFNQIAYISNNFTTMTVASKIGMTPCRADSAILHPVLEIMRVAY